MAIPPIVPIETPSGRYLIFDGRDMINETLGREGAWEPFVTEIAYALVTMLDPRPGTILDVGANLGAISIPLARRLPRQFTFHCFEMQRIVFYQLCGNILLNGLENMYAHHLGLGAADGTIAVPRPDYATEQNIGGMSVAPGVRAPASMTEPTGFRTLDSFGFKDIRLIKADVEGMELDVVKGSLRTLKDNDYPPLLLEAWKSGKPGEMAPATRELVTYLGEIGYRWLLIGTNCVAQYGKRPWIKVGWDKETGPTFDLRQP